MSFQILLCMNNISKVLPKLCNKNSPLTMIKLPIHFPGSLSATGYCKYFAITRPSQSLSRKHTIILVFKFGIKNCINQRYIYSFIYIQLNIFIYSYPAQFIYLFISIHPTHPIQLICQASCFINKY